MQVWGFQRPAGNADQPSTLPVRTKPSGFCFLHASAHAYGCAVKNTERKVAKGSRCDLWMENRRIARSTNKACPNHQLRNTSFFVHALYIVNPTQEQTIP